MPGESVNQAKDPKSPKKNPGAGLRYWASYQIPLLTGSAILGQLLKLLIPQVFICKRKITLATIIQGYSED